MKIGCAESISLLVLGLACTSAGIAQSADPVEELKACARITDRDARFACFDNLGERVLREESAAEKPTPKIVAQPEAVETTVTATEAPSLPDDLGGPEFADKEALKNIKHRGLITSCKQGQNNKWFFFFENGQVWKQVGSRLLRYKKCNFTVTVTKDAFGYKMQIDGDEKTIRISRRR